MIFGKCVPYLPIIARATGEEGTKRLTQVGATDVIHPELESGLEIVRHTLLQLGFPLQQIYQYTDAVRRDHYDMHLNTEEEHLLLHELIDAAGGITIRWFRIQEGSVLIRQTIQQANLRAQTGASIVALMRQGTLMPNPKSMTVFQADDRIGLIGDNEEVSAAENLFLAPQNDSLPTQRRSRRSHPF